MISIKLWAPLTNPRYLLTIQSVSTDRVVLLVNVNRDISAVMESAKDSVLTNFSWRHFYQKL